MELIREEEIGEVDFFGKTAIALREIYTNNVWKFVLIVENRRIVMMLY